jgi:hypothetical protein
MGFLTGMISGTWSEVLESLVGVAGGAAGMQPVKEIVSDARARAAGQLPLPKNHDLVRTIRTAYLAALEKVTLAHAEHLGLVEASAEERAFGASARAYLDQRLSIVNAKKLDFDAVNEAEVRHVLDDMVHPSATEGYATMAQEARKRAEAEALGELETDAGRRAPPLFRRFFEGDGVRGLGWYETYALFVNEQIKTNERFRSIFLAAELVDIKRLVEAADRRLVELDRQRSSQIEQGFARAETEAERRQRELLEGQRALMEAITGKSHVPIRLLEDFLRKLGEAEVPAEAIPARLEAWAERFLEMKARLSQPSNDRPETAVARARARELLDAGDLDGAETALRDARGALRERREQTAREEATLLGDEAGIAQLRLDYAAEADLHREAARLLDFDMEAAWAAWMRVANALYRDGVEFGDPAALRAAVRTLEQEALHRAPRNARPLDWATVQHNLGCALATLGERRDDDALAKATAAYEDALWERTRERAPLDWAKTQNNLGNILQILGERGDDDAIVKAISAYENAMQELTRERAPLAWATAQNNLGCALATLGERGDVAALVKAVAAYQNSLLECTRERNPLDWAGTQNNLGRALHALGKRGDVAALVNAVAAHENGLLECTRERAPLAWAKAQNNLGCALATLSEYGDGAALAKAITAYENALLELTQDCAPLQWAGIQNNLGIALLTLGKRGDDEALARAVVAHEKALLELSRERTPLDWASTQNALGVALQILGERGDDRAFAKAVTAYENALLELTRKGVPLDWARTQNNLGIAFLNLGLRGDDEALARAVVAFGNASLERTRERDPLDWAKTQGNIALAEMALGNHGGGAEMWGAALRRVDAALEEFLAHSPHDAIPAKLLAARLRAKLNPPG